MTKSSAIAQLRNRYDANVNGVQVVAGSNPATPTSERKAGGSVHLNRQKSQRRLKIIVTTFLTLLAGFRVTIKVMPAP